jgi:uncharacterized membrane protein YkvA (DUF1232 family)
MLCTLRLFGLTLAYPRATIDSSMRKHSLWKQWAAKLRLEAFTLYYAYRNPKTPWYAKLWTAIVVAYAFSPIDLIPDFIPILGYLDDLVLIPLGMAVAVKLIPKEILDESRQLARQRIDGKKPINWIAGALIIGIWATVLVFVFYKIIGLIIE